MPSMSRSQKATPQTRNSAIGSVRMPAASLGQPANPETATRAIQARSLGMVTSERAMRRRNLSMSAALGAVAFPAAADFEIAGDDDRQDRGTEERQDGIELHGGAV